MTQWFLIRLLLSIVKSMYNEGASETFTLVLTVVKDLDGIGSSGKTKDYPGEVMGHVTDGPLRHTLSQGSIENTQLLHEVVEEPTLKQLGCDQTCEQGVETHTGETSQLEDGEEDHGDGEQGGVLCQDGPE